MGLLNKKGNLKGVEALIYFSDKDEWEPQQAIGYRVGDKFFIGIEELENGYMAEITLSAKALIRMLKELGLYKEAVDKWDYLEGDFPT